MLVRNLYFNVDVISRGGGQSAPAASSYRSGTVVHHTGRSAVASASYRSGEVLHDERLDQTFDYTRKEDVLHAEILAPESAPDWVQNRGQLWNTVEAQETRVDSQLARDIIAVLPRGLNEETYIKLVREFVNDNFVRRGMVADFAVHDKDASDGGRNPHAHIMLSMRDIDKDGFSTKKNRTWNRKELVSRWRDAMETICNRYLEEAGVNYRISLSSYEKQGIDKVPGEHLGPHVWGLEQKGRKTEKGDRNREVRRDNKANEFRKSWEPVFAPDNDNEPQEDALLAIEQSAEPTNIPTDEKGKHPSPVGQPRIDAIDAPPTPPDNLRDVARRQEDSTSDAGTDPRAARRDAFVRSVASRTVQATIAFATRMARYARDKAAELMRDETSGGDPFTRYGYENLRQVSRKLETESDKDHER